MVFLSHGAVSPTSVYTKRDYRLHPTNAALQASPRLDHGCVKRRLALPLSMNFTAPAQHIWPTCPLKICPKSHRCKSFCAKRWQEACYKAFPRVSQEAFQGVFRGVFRGPFQETHCDKSTLVRMTRESDPSDIPPTDTPDTRQFDNTRSSQGPYSDSPQDQDPLIYVMGVSGCGKSTVAQLLALNPTSKKCPGVFR